MNVLKSAKPLKLFSYGIALSLLIALLLVNILPAYQSMPIVDIHLRIFYSLLCALMLYSANVYWFHMQHRTVFKIIIIPILLFLCCVVGVCINNMLLTPLFLSVPILAEIIHNWIYNMLWFVPFCISLTVPFFFYIERSLFNWVRAHSINQKK